MLTFAAATNSQTVGRTPGSARVGRNSRKGVQAFTGKINSAVGRLNYAVLTGNFAGVYSGSRLIVERTDGTLEFVTDMSKMQQAKLTEQANALRVYYRTLEGYLLRMPTEKYKKLMGNAKRMSIKLAVFNAVKMSERSMYRLIKDFEANGYALSEFKSGKHERRWIVNNEIWGRKCREYVRENAIKKGAPNMTVSDFQQFVNSEILPKLLPGAETRGLSKATLQKGINVFTARQWLLHLGCFFKEGRKDVYYDGHERPDVVEYRNLFVPRLLSYLNDPNMVVIFQDEVIYKSFEGQTSFWHVPQNIETGAYHQ